MNSNNDLEKVESEFKEKESLKKKRHKVSGKSIFDLQKIIKEKADELKERDESKH